MNIKLLTVGVLLCAMISCSKNTDEPVDPPAPVDSLPPLQLTKKISRYIITATGELVGDSTSYTYDEQGRLTATINLATNQPTRKFIYEGEELIALVQVINGQSDTLHSPVTLSDNGNTIFLDHTLPSSQGPADTIQLTYKWSGDQILESWEYVHFGSWGAPALQKTFFEYDQHGNFYKQTAVHSDGYTDVQITALSYDDKKNFFRTLPRLDYIFIGWGFSYATRSVNNLLKAETQHQGVQEFIWTYNDEGYPLTMQVKGQDFIAAEFFYNR